MLHLQVLSSESKLCEPSKGNEPQSLLPLPNVLTRFNLDAHRSLNKLRVSFSKLLSALSSVKNCPYDGYVRLVAGVALKSPKIVPA